MIFELRFLRYGKRDGYPETIAREQDCARAQVELRRGGRGDRGVRQAIHLFGLDLPESDAGFVKPTRPSAPPLALGHLVAVQHRPAASPIASRPRSGVRARVTAEVEDLKTRPVADRSSGITDPIASEVMTGGSRDTSVLL